MLRRTFRRSNRPSSHPASTTGAEALRAQAIGASVLGALAAGAAAAGAIAIGVLAIRRLAIKRGKIERLSIEELEVGRLHVRELIRESGAPRPFETLEGHKYMRLTTFRKSGEAVPTTVWFVLFEGGIYVTTDPDSGKMKRIRNNSHVLLAPSTRLGKPRGESIEGIAHPLQPGAAPEDATRAFSRKYRPLLNVLHLLISREIGTLTLEINPTEDKNESEEAHTWPT